MKTIAIAALFGFVAAENLFLNSEMSDLEKEFVAFSAKHGKSYATEAEYNIRFGIFTQNFLKVVESNQQNGSFVTGVNQFADWSKPEFEQLLGYKPSNRTTLAIDDEDDPSLRSAGPVDWRPKGAVTDVKNQGSCGSCWTFSTTGAMEGAVFLGTGELPILSEQLLVDCAKNAYDNPGTGGCEGGEMNPAFDYIIKHGETTEEKYPYKAADGECRQDLVDAAEYHLSGYNVVKANSVEALKAEIEQGPVAVAIQADQFPFQFYAGGVLDDPACGTALNHAVLAVGWGSEEGKDYYIVKNSWGAGWGESGYVKIAAVEGEGICGIQKDSSRPYV